jgi:hypothetical protein
VYIGIITIVASAGPVIVPALLDWVSTFNRCSSGVKYALLIVVPSFYLCASLLFLLLGVVNVWWERKGGHYSVLDTPPHTEDTNASDVVRPTR